MIAWFALGWILLLGKLSGAQAARMCTNGDPFLVTRSSIKFS